MNKKTKIKLILIGIAVYLFLCLYIIHIFWVLKDGIGIENAFGAGIIDLFTQPFNIFPIPSKALLIIFAITVLVPLIIFLQRQNAELKKHYNPDTVQGAGKWMKDEELRQFQYEKSEPIGTPKYDSFSNVILSKELSLSLNAKKIDRNLNVFIVGGSGSGKSFRVVGPNILQANCSFLVNDPSGGLLSQYGTFLEHRGYKVKVFNLQHMERGNHYNPFKYVKSDKDVRILVDTLMVNTTPKDKKGGDPFWEDTTRLLLSALVSFLHHYCPKEDQNFTRLMYLVRTADTPEESDGRSALDIMFERAIPENERECFCYSQYKDFKLAATKTLKSILISVASRLSAFDLEDVRKLTSSDNIDLDTLADEKTALFVILPTGESSFNFLSAMMYSQLFQRTYDYCENYAEFTQCLVDRNGEVVKSVQAESEAESQQAAEKLGDLLNRIRQTARIVRNPNTKLYEITTEAGEIIAHRGTEGEAEKALDKICHGAVVSNKKGSNEGKQLPVHYNMILDEIANVGKIPGLQERVATIRKYEMSVMIVVQSLQQMEGNYKDEYESIISNCDSTIYLGGGADVKTGEWLQKLMGKETRRALSLSFNDNNGGNQSIGPQGVEMYTVADARTMKEDECIVIVRAMDPYRGKKYWPLAHPRWEEHKKLPAYKFNAKKAEYIALSDAQFRKKLNPKKQEEKELISEEQEKQIKERLDRENEEAKAKAAEAARNMDALGNEAVGDPEVPTEDDDSALRNAGVNEQNVDSGEFLQTNSDLFADGIFYEKM